jgi:hypothetical protein
VRPLEAPGGVPLGFDRRTLQPVSLAVFDDRVCRNAADPEVVVVSSRAVTALRTRYGRVETRSWGKLHDALAEFHLSLKRNYAI